MDGNRKRFTISIPPDMEISLDKLKQTQFYNKSEAEMFRFLIQRGLEEIGRSSKDASKEPPA